MKYLRLSFLRLMILMCLAYVLPSNMSAQNKSDSLCVYTEKSGKLKKLLKDTDLLKLRVLKVVGAVNQKDLNYIAKMPSSISVLDFSEAIYVSNFNICVSLPRLNNVTEYHDFLLWKITGLYGSNIAMRHDKPLPFRNLKVIGMSYDGTLSYKEHKIDKLVIHPSLSKNHGYFDGEKPAVVVADLMPYATDTEKMYSDALAKSVDRWTYPLVKVQSPKVSGYVVKKWDDTYPKEILKDIVSIKDGAFAGTRITEFKNKLLESIPEGCFKDCSLLKSVDLPNVKVIGAESFRGCTMLSSVSIPVVTEIQEMAFADCHSLTNLPIPSVRLLGSRFVVGSGISNLTLPATIETVENDFYEYVDEVEFTSKFPPQMKGSISSNVRSTIFVIPRGSMPRYSEGAFAQALKFEKGTDTKFSYTVEKPGTLGKYINNDNYMMIRDLTIKGVLYDTDIEVINRCEALRRLDLSECYVMVSPKTINDKRMSDAALLSLFSAAADEVVRKERIKKNMGYGNSVVLEKAKSISSELNKNLADMKNEKVKIPTHCITPQINLRSLVEIIFPQYIENFSVNEDSVSIPALRKIVLPKRAKTISFNITCNNLSSIILPDKAESICGFNNLRNLINLDLRNCSLKTISEAFNNCENLKSVNMEGSSVEVIDNSFNGCNAMRSFTSGKMLRQLRQSLYSSGYYRRYHANDETKEKFNAFIHVDEMPLGDMNWNIFDEIHIPAGTASGWPAYLQQKLADDITH